jgi:RNA polymerase sigma-70 factor, ECF subfamily
MSRDAFVTGTAIHARESLTDRRAPAMMDEASFQACYRQTAAPLRAYAARVLGDVGLADDITQESYLRLLRAGPPTADPAQLRAFLFRVASNLIVDHWRRRGREQKTIEGSVPRSSVPEVDVPLRLDFARVFEQLGPQERQMLWLAYVEGAEHREIAAALGLRTGSIRVLLHRARRKLARLMESGRGKGEG